LRLKWLVIPNVMMHSAFVHSFRCAPHRVREQGPRDRHNAGRRAFWTQIIVPRAVVRARGLSCYALSWGAGGPRASGLTASGELTAEIRSRIAAGPEVAIVASGRTRIAAAVSWQLRPRGDHTSGFASGKRARHDRRIELANECYRSTSGRDTCWETCDIGCSANQSGRKHDLRRRDRSRSRNC